MVSPLKDELAGTPDLELVFDKYFGGLAAGRKNGGAPEFQYAPDGSGITGIDNRVNFPDKSNCYMLDSVLVINMQL